MKKNPNKPADGHTASEARVVSRCDLVFARLDAAARRVGELSLDCVDWSTALCRGHSDEMFRSTRVSSEVRGRCERCPIAEECLADALVAERGDASLVFWFRAGTTADQRKRWLAERRPGGRGRRPIRELCDLGWLRANASRSVNAIADELGCDRTTVHKAFKRAGVDRRTVAT